MKAHTCATKGVFSFNLFSCNFDDQIFTDFLFYAMLEYTGLWQLPKVSSAFKWNSCRVASCVSYVNNSIYPNVNELLRFRISPAKNMLSGLALDSMLCQLIGQSEIQKETRLMVIKGFDNACVWSWICELNIGKMHALFDAPIIGFA